MKRCFNVARLKTCDMRGEVGGLPVIDGFVHGDVEELAKGVLVIDACENCANQILYMDEAALERTSFRIAHHRERLSTSDLREALRIDDLPPRGTSELRVRQIKCEPEVILLHDPRRSQRRPIETILAAELLQHHLLENLGEGITAFVCLARGMLGDRMRIFLKDMPDDAVTTQQDELARI